MAEVGNLARARALEDDPGVAKELPTAALLGLVTEAKIADLLGESPTGRYEASGVVRRDDVSYVVFDNMPHIGKVASLTAGAEQNVLLNQNGRLGYEDIAHDPVTDHFFALTEASPRGKGFMAKIHEYDGEFRHLSTDWLDFPLETANTGMEGLTCVSSASKLYLLAVCEGNRCRGGDAGREPGGGRIQVFERRRHGWGHVATIRLPAKLPFRDFSSVAVSGQRIAVLSQESAALWLGTLRTPGWDVVDEGVIYRFPVDEEGRTAYGNAEGVAWLSADRVVVVSDRVKDDQHRRSRAKDESIHVFMIPAAPSREPAVMSR